MTPARLTLALALLAFAVLLAVPAGPATASELVRVTAHVNYDIRPDPSADSGQAPSTGSGQGLGPVHVSWQISVENNDPETANTGGTVFAYDRLPDLPVLRGATNLAALSSAGTPLAVTLDDSRDGPILGAEVEFDRPLFYQESYSFSLEYDLPATRDESLLITPFYVFIPLVAAGDQATVTVSTPGDGGWEEALEAGDCTQDAFTFTCTGSDSIYLAAFAEVSRPDATATIPIDLALRERNVSLTLTYFQGEEPWAQHLQELITASLPIIEELYGFPYSGPFAINVAERGRQVILGYEGLTTCDPAAACDIAVSPIADDFTVLHELAHLWSDVYAQRWLVEGFAELIAREAAARLPPGLVQGTPPSRSESALDLRLDDWGDITSVIAASDEQRQTEDAGYDRSLRFLLLLKTQMGLEALQQANALIAESGQPADSGRFLDALEDVSGQNPDQLFARWVFPDSFAPTLQARRQARDRLAALAAQAQAEGLSSDVPDAIRQDVFAWRFAEALAALDHAEASLQTYAEIKDELSGLRADVQEAGFTFPETIDAALSRWDFDAARLALVDAERAVDAYLRAREKVDAPRNLWERFGLLGRDPDSSLDAAARAFARGDFQTALEEANSAAKAIDDASRVALTRLLIFLGILAATVLAMGLAFWLARRHSRRYLEP